MARAAVDELRLLLGADRLRLPAARAEAAARRRVGRARDVALQHDPLALAALARLLDRHRRQERLRVRMRRALVDVVLRADLDDLAEIHHRDAVGDVPHDRQVVRDEDVGQAEVALQRLEQVDHLRADRDVERRDRLVEDDQLRVQRERPRDADALPLAARELVREAVRVLGREPDDAQQLVDASLALVAAGARRGCASGSLTMSRTVIRGLSDAYGSWKTICISRRTSRICAALEARDVAAVEDDLPRRRLRQLDQRPRQRRLAAARLADEAERLAGLDRQVDAVDGVDLSDGALEDPGADREVLDETLDAEDLLAASGPLVDRLEPARARRSRDTASENFDLRPISSSAKWHALRCSEPPALDRTSGGTSSRHCSRPARGSSADGTDSPAAGRSATAASPVIGSQPLLVLRQLRQAVHQPDRVRMPRRAGRSCARRRTRRSCRRT